MRFKALPGDRLTVAKSRFRQETGFLFAIAGHGMTTKGIRPSSWGVQRARGSVWGQDLTGTHINLIRSFANNAIALKA